MYKGKLHRDANCKDRNADIRGNELSRAEHFGPHRAGKTGAGEVGGGEKQQVAMRESGLPGR